MAKEVVSAWRHFLLLVMMVLSAGCSDGKPKRVPIAGKVLIDGKPLTLGSIQFVPEGARPSGGAIDRDGHFVLSCYVRGDGAVIGAHRVRVTAAQNVSEKELRWEAPKMYADIATSGIVVHVDAPADDVVINLTWNGGKPFVERFQ
jgi:hypothetical protein